MAIPRKLFANDFKKLARGPYLFDRWSASPSLDTPLGNFRVELNMKPDDKLLSEANLVAKFVFNKPDAVISAVYESYLAASYDEGWMESCQVPLGLTETQAVKYADRPAISVRRSRTGEVSGVIYFSPRWDEEHGLYLKLSGGGVVRTEP